MRRAEAKNGILFVLPWIIGFLGFTLYPILSSLYYSFCDYSVIKEPVFTGVKNYVTLFHDQTFIKACKNTAYMMLIGVPVTTFFAVAVSVILNSKKLRHTGWMRVVFFIPTLVPTVVACLLWIWVMQPETGVVNTLLGYIGIKGPGWLASPTWATANKIIQTLRVTVGESINVYAVHPGRMNTDMGRTTAQIEPEEAAIGFCNILEGTTHIEKDQWFIDYRGNAMPL